MINCITLVNSYRLRMLKWAIEFEVLLTRKLVHAFAIVLLHNVLNSSVYYTVCKLFCVILKENDLILANKTIML